MPSERWMTKSSMVAWSKVTSPRIRSCDDGLALVGRAEAQGARPVEAAVAAEAVVAGVVALGAGLDVLPGAVAAVGVARRRAAGRRPRRRASARSDWRYGPLVPVDAEPAQRALDALDQLVAGARGVGVLDAQDERAARRGGRTAS